MPWKKRCRFQKKKTTQKRIPSFQNLKKFKTSHHPWCQKNPNPNSYQSPHCIINVLNWSSAWMPIMRKWWRTCIRCNDPAFVTDFCSCGAEVTLPTKNLNRNHCIVSQCIVGTRQQSTPVCPCKCDCECFHNGLLVVWLFLVFFFLHTWFEISKIGQLLTAKTRV